MVMRTRSTFPAILTMLAFGLAWSTTAAQNLPVSAILSRMPNRWEVTECCGWTGTWQRRSGTNTFDATWKHSNGTTATDVLEFTDYQQGQVTIRRASLNGHYKAYYENNSLVRGTATWYPTGTTWSARAVAEIQDEKGPVNIIRRR